MEAKKKCRLENDTDSSSSTISSSAIREIINKLKVQGRRSSTRHNYHTVWKLFNNFFIKLDQKPAKWEDRLILFVGFFIENGRKATTVKSYISVVKAVLQEDGVPLNIDRCLINSLTKACRYQNDMVHTRLPICKNLLMLILAKIPEIVTEQQPYLIAMYQALFSTAYYGLFRVGELCESPHTVKIRNVHISNRKNKLLFILRTSKTHWKDVPPQAITISSDAVVQMHSRTVKKNRWCPYQLLRDYITLRKKGRFIDEQFFIFRDRSPVKPEHMRTTLKKALVY